MITCDIISRAVCTSTVGSCILQYCAVIYRANVQETGSPDEDNPDGERGA